MSPPGKPTLRGVPDVAALLIFAPLVALLLWSAKPDARVPALVYGGALLALFGVSAGYHKPTWSARALLRWRRVDHSMIYVFIAASYAPPAALVFDGAQARVILSITWGGAALGVLKTTPMSTCDSSRNCTMS